MPCRIALTGVVVSGTSSNSRMCKCCRLKNRNRDCPVRMSLHKASVSVNTSCLKFIFFCHFHCLHRPAGTSSACLFVPPSSSDVIHSLYGILIPLKCFHEIFQGNIFKDFPVLLIDPVYDQMLDRLLISPET